jgi:putative transposase
MAHTFHQHYYHLVWSTKERQPLILNEYKDRIFEFLGGSLRTLGCVSLQAGGMNDHVHILAGIPPQYAVSEIVRDIKVASSKWINASLPKAMGFSWQEGYGSFSVSTSQKRTVLNYILNQEKHHKIKSFRDEFIELLDLHEIEYDKNYLWQ